jgi:hypothetical protein
MPRLPFCIRVSDMKTHAISTKSGPQVWESALVCSATIWIRKSGDLDENYLAAM